MCFCEKWPQKVTLSLNINCRRKISGFSKRHMDVCPVDARLTWWRAGRGGTAGVLSASRSKLGSGMILPCPTLGADSVWKHNTCQTRRILSSQRWCPPICLSHHWADERHTNADLQRSLLQQGRDWDDSAVLLHYRSDTYMFLGELYTLFSVVYTYFVSLCLFILNIR